MPRQAALDHLNALARRLAGDADALDHPQPGTHGAAKFAAGEKEALIQALQADHGRDHRDDITHHGEDMAHWLAQLRDDLYEDLGHALGASQAPALARVGLRFMSHLHCDAFVLGLGEPPQHSWAVGIHLGLVWVANLVALALLAAARGDDESARRAHAAALDTYCSASSGRATPWAGLPATNNDEALQAGALGSVVLRFVALHELGHALLGHVDGWQMGVSEQGRRHYAGAVTADAGATQAMELAADRFALMQMIGVSSGPEAMWNNLLFIAGFFRLLATVEARQGRPLCPYHPPPAERVARLEALLREHMGPPPNDAWTWAQAQHEAWSLP